MDQNVILFSEFKASNGGNFDTRWELYLLNILSSAILKAPIPSRLKGNAACMKNPIGTFSILLAVAAIKQWRCK